MKKLLNLCLHCGGHEAAWEDVQKVPVPEATQSWTPIGHHELVESVVATLGGTGLHVTQSVHALWSEGNRYFGSFQLENGGGDHPDYALVVGLRNSHDKTFPAGLACGSGVFVCDNLAFSGEIRLSRKHTARIREDLPRLITACVGRLGSMKLDQEKRIEAYKAKPVNNLEAHDLVVRAVDAGALSVTKLPAVLQEWRKPRHQEFEPRTAWSLFNGFTQTMKADSVATLARRTMPLHGLFDVLAGLQVQQYEDATIEGGCPVLIQGA